jgi:hypothetical protein
MIGFTEQRYRVEMAAAMFPQRFGLRAFPGETFRISLQCSYVNDAGDVQLYTERDTTIEGACRWQQFCKGSIAELRSQLTHAPVMVLHPTGGRR